MDEQSGVQTEKGLVQASDLPTQPDLGSSGPDASPGYQRAGEGREKKLWSARRFPVSPDSSSQSLSLPCPGHSARVKEVDKEESKVLLRKDLGAVSLRPSVLKAGQGSQEVRARKEGPVPAPGGSSRDSRPYFPV